MNESSVADSIRNFFRRDSAVGITLLVATIAALVVANSPLNGIYQKVLELKLSISLSTFTIEHSIKEWINEGLMSLFFLVVGLEIKRELKYGELSSFQSAMMPVVAALCGAALPALIFYSLNTGTEFVNGWAIPMATDIAFVVGIMALLSSRMPVWAKVLVTAIAVVDDIIAVLVIAFFFAEQIKIVALGVAALCLLILVIFSYSGIKRLWPYLVIGFVMWGAVLNSGVHSTIAGVILGFAIPASRRWDLEQLQEYAQEGIDLFKKAADEEVEVTRKQAMRHMGKSQFYTKSPLHRMEDNLRPFVYFMVMPLFAFVNAGLVFYPGIINAALHSALTYGIILGLFLGKQIGVFGAIWISTKLGLYRLNPDREIWKIIYGIALLTGIGFTMSLFITELAFTDDKLLRISKIGILVGSLLCGLLGYYFLYRRPEYKAEDHQAFEE